MIMKINHSDTACGSAKFSTKKIPNGPACNRTRVSEVKDQHRTCNASGLNEIKVL